MGKRQTGQCWAGVSASNFIPHLGKRNFEADLPLLLHQMLQGPICCSPFKAFFHSDTQLSAASSASHRACSSESTSAGFASVCATSSRNNAVKCFRRRKINVLTPPTLKLSSSAIRV